MLSLPLLFSVLMPMRTKSVALWGLLLPLLGSLWLTSCREEVYASDPVYDKMVFTLPGAPQEPIYSAAVGDSVVALVAFSYPGEYVTRSDQKWTMVTSDTTITISRRVVDPCGKMPELRFKVPAGEGEVALSFSERYSYSAQKETGQIFGASTTLTGHLRIRKN